MPPPWLRQDWGPGSGDRLIGNKQDVAYPLAPYPARLAAAPYALDISLTSTTRRSRPVPPSRSSIAHQTSRYGRTLAPGSWSPRLVSNRRRGRSLPPPDGRDRTARIHTLPRGSPASRLPPRGPPPAPSRSRPVP